MNVVQEVEVASITKVEKPKSPEEAIKVEVRATKEQAEKIERFKKQMVTTVVRTPGGRPGTEADADTVAIGTIEG